METVNLPTEKASEPDEEARQPLPENMTPKQIGKPSKKLITFADDTDTEKSPSQKSSTFKEVLSQPAPNLSHRQKMLWLQKRRSTGLWAQCDDCDRWRFLADVLDRYELPKKWYCRMNPDTANADCSVPEAPIRLRDEEDLIHGEYSAGSVVWARMAGWPWWPAMVDDCVDTEQYYWLDGFSDIPTHYNVVFFDSTDVTRGWISPENLKPYTEYKNSFKTFLKAKKYKNRLQAAMNQADAAVKLSQPERLDKYSFVARYQGALNSPKKVNKKDVKKHQKILKRKYNIEFESESEEERVIPRHGNSNVIILGTPKGAKRAKAKRDRNTNKSDVTVTSTVNEEQKETAQENVEVDKAAGTEQDTDASTDVFKRPNSMAVLVGSNQSATVEDPYDDDTSKTYLPPATKESQESTQLTQDSTVTSEITEMQVRMSSPASDDFDF